MPKKSTPDADLRSEFTALRAIAKEEKALTAALNRTKDRKRKAVHNLSVKKNANVASMAAIFGVSRQALAKEIGAVKKTAAAKKAPAKKAPARKKAAAKKAAPRKRVVRTKPEPTQLPAEADVVA